MTYTRRMKTPEKMRSRKTIEDGKISHAHGLEESTYKNGYTTKTTLYVFFSNFYFILFYFLNVFFFHFSFIIHMCIQGLVHV
jgi:hypothetical protein